MNSSRASASLPASRASWPRLCASMHWSLLGSAPAAGLGDDTIAKLKNAAMIVWLVFSDIIDLLQGSNTACLVDLFLSFEIERRGAFRDLLRRRRGRLRFVERLVHDLELARGDLDASIEDNVVASQDLKPVTTGVELRAHRRNVPQRAVDLDNQPFGHC